MLSRFIVAPNEIRSTADVATEQLYPMIDWSGVQVVKVTRLKISCYLPARFAPFDCSYSSDRRGQSACSCFLSQHFPFPKHPGPGITASQASGSRVGILSIVKIFCGKRFSSAFTHPLFHRFSSGPTSVLTGSPLPHLCKEQLWNCLNLTATNFKSGPFSQRHKLGFGCGRCSAYRDILLCLILALQTPFIFSTGHSQVVSILLLPTK